MGDSVSEFVEACVSAARELILQLMWFPPVVMMSVVLVVVLQVLIEYPVALLPL